MLAYETGMMNNPLSRLIWRICQIDGKPSRYRGEPQRQHPRGRAAALDFAAR
jgi:hypothetical protein